MSDPDAMPDPIDEAYVEAEAVLNDEAARLARRDRVLAAVAQQEAAEAAKPPERPRLWRRGGWLVAASVSGLALVLASQLYQPTPYPPPISQTPAAPTPATKSPAVASLPAVVVQGAATGRAAPRAGKPSAPPPTIVARSSAPPPVVVASPPPPPVAVASPPPSPPPAVAKAAPASESPRDEVQAAPPPQVAANDQVAPAKPPNQRADASVEGQTSVTDIVVTAEKRQSRRQSVPAAISAFASRSRDAIDPAAGLRAAAAAGRTGDMERLLKRGVPVDAPDADGETALMKSVQGDHAAAVALLRRHGASVDLKNHAGENAGQMAKEIDDPDLSRAIGLGP